MILGLPAGLVAAGLLAALVAGVVRGLAGFGLAILLVPLLGLVATPQEAVVATNWLAVFTGLFGFSRVIREAERSAFPIAALAMLATPLGVVLLGLVPPAPARLAIALIAIAAFAAILMPPRAAGHRPSAAETGATGIAAGLLTGFAGMPGPPVVPYYLRRTLPPATARSSMLVVFFAAALAGGCTALAIGAAHGRSALLALALWPMVVIGNWLGFRLHDRVSPRVWRIVTGATLGAAALVAAVKLAMA